MDGIIRMRGGRGVGLRDHYILRYLCGLQGYLRNHRHRLVLEVVNTNERGREIRIGNGREIEEGIEEGIEIEGDMEGQLVAGMEMEAAVAGSVGVCRIHSSAVRAQSFLFTGHLFVT